VGDSPSPQNFRRFIKRDDVAFVFHTLAFLMHARVWVWHTSPAASALPGGTGFGWFFRYLTFWSYTFQLLQLFLCVLAHLVKGTKRRRALSAAADRLSCAVFGMANTVTAMFYAIESATKGLVEGGLNERPWWLAAAVHSVNSIVAWLDLLIVEERSFSGKSRHLALLVGSTYGTWLLLVRHMYGKFPYPVLNALPFPWGYLGFFATGMASIALAFELGKFVKQQAVPAVSSRTQRRRRQHRAKTS